MCSVLYFGIPEQLGAGTAAATGATAVLNAYDISLGSVETYHGEGRVTPKGIAKWKKVVDLS